MQYRIFAEIQKAFSGINFEAQPTTDLVMVESLKCYRSILAVMKEEALKDLTSYPAADPIAQDAAASLPRINERLQKVESYIRLYSTPADVVSLLPDFSKSQLAICRIRPGHKVDRQAVSILRLLDEGDRQHVDDPRAYLIVQGGGFVRKTTLAEKVVYGWHPERGIYSVEHSGNTSRDECGLMYSTDNGVTFDRLPDNMIITEEQAGSLRACGWEPLGDKRFTVL